MTWTFDRAHSEISIETTAKGMFAKLAHDLRLLAGEVSADVSEKEGHLELVLRAPVRAIKVDGVRKSGAVDLSTLSASDRSDIEKKVKELICQQLEVSEDKLSPEASFIDDLKADSLAVVELVLALEQEFRLEIPEEDTERIKTVGDAVGYIKSHAKA